MIAVFVLTASWSVAVSAQPPEVSFRFVPGVDVQAGGPAYDFRISQFEIRDDQFVAFLNDALGHPSDERGQYLYFDTASGDVYVNTSQTGATGSGAGGRTVLAFTPAATGQIEFVAGEYVVAIGGYADHPVTGVTWYGAVKYCNWLTIEHGLGIDARAYTEGTAADLTQWRPITISASNWATRDLNATERAELVAIAGYRLPMDGGTDAASAYNEWYKVGAASVDGRTGAVVFDALYGFGRNSIGPADANFNDSDDPFEPGTTPVGFYDGVSTLATGTPTSDTANAFHLYDLSGNVWEWMQDQVSTDPTRRRNRGGSWRNPGGSLLRVDRSANRLATSQDDATGIRVVQSVLAPVRVSPSDDLQASGVWGGPYVDPPGDAQTYALTNLTDSAVDYTVDVSAPWVRAAPATGTIAPGNAVQVVVSILSDCAAGIEVGGNDALVAFVVGSETIAQRGVSFDALEPIAVTPSTGLASVMPFGGQPVPAGGSFVLQSSSDRSASWSASWSDTSSPPAGVAWINVNDAATASGTIPSHSARAVNVDIVPSVVATLPDGDYSADIEFVDECTGQVEVRTVTLTVVSPFIVTPDGTTTLESVGVYGGPFAPGEFDLAMTRGVTQSISWHVSLCDEPAGSSTCTPPALPWLLVQPAFGTLTNNNPLLITATLGPEAEALVPGEYATTLRFFDDESTYALDRTIHLHVTGLEVSPVDDVNVGGPIGGPFEPAITSFTLTNSTATQMSWEASVKYTPPLGDIGNVAWLSISPMVGAILDPGGEEIVEAEITQEAELLSPGVYEAELTFTPNETPEAATTRKLTLEVSGEAFSLDMKLVPGEDVQPSGPTHTFRIGTYEVTNREYARFLNDARRNQSSERGQYLYFDTLTGSVWIAPTAGEGPLPPIGPDTAVVYDAARGRIDYDENQAAPYVVETGFEDHPVVGVSWYGAAKFCNWLTITQSIPLDRRAYAEGPTAADWLPIDFDPGDPASNLTGFRLPMDGMQGGADLFNEWNKVATYTGTVNDVAHFDADYGFGRDTLAGADANYLASGDPEDDGTTSVGYFNGLHPLADESFTRGNQNGYGLYDLTGNVAEWVHEIDTSSGSARSATRGGHFLDAAVSTSLLNNGRVVRPADGAYTFVGFRVAQSLSPQTVVVDEQATPVRARGPVGGSFDATSFSIGITNDADYTLDHVAYSLSSNGAWLGFDGTPASQIPALSSSALTLELTDAAESLGVSPEPAEDMALVPADEVLATGATYDFWIARTEVTNAQFAAFLNDTRADAALDEPTARSDYLYFDDAGGDVYVNDEQSPAIEPGPPQVASPTLLYDTTVGRISLDGETYVVESGYENHPVVGVSWFGAIKYCNWLTLHRGMPEAMRAYSEGPMPHDWHPVTVATVDWIARGITSDERLALVERTTGYRLPMDGGGGASASNEWSKAASARIDDAGLVAFDAGYGFGRNALAAADANYFDSRDTEENGTTPVGYFDGMTTLADGETTTTATDNRYGLFDITGNVAEWLQDTGTTGDISDRTARGGSWRDAISSPLLRSAGRTSYPPDTVRDDLGFRIVRGTGYVGQVDIGDRIADETHTRYVILDVTEPLDVSPLSSLQHTGPFCTNLLTGTEPVTYTIRNDSVQAMPLELDADADWITLTSTDFPALSGELDPGASTELTVTLNGNVNDLLPGAHNAVISITRDTEPRRALTRTARATIEPSASAAFVDGEVAYTGFWEGPFDGPTDPIIQIERCADCGPCDLDYDVTSSEPWITIEPDNDLAGTMPPVGTTIDLSVALNEAAEELDPGEYTADVVVTLIDPQHGVLPSPLKVEVKLSVLDPIEIDGDQDDWPVPCVLGGEGTTRIYTLTNRHGASEVSMTIGADAPWIDVEPTFVSIAPGASADVSVTLNEAALPSVETDMATLSFNDLLTGYTQAHELTVRIDQSLCVTPLLNVDAWGRVGGAVTPASSHYEIANISDAAIDWRVDTDATWLLVNGARRDAAPLTGNLGAGGTFALTALVNTAALPSLGPGHLEGTFTTTMTITNLSGTDAPLTREFRVHLVNPLTSTNEALVDAAADQPNGPNYSYYLGRYHVTNAEFVVFLNDAMSHPDSPRGAYLFFDTATGDVYVNDAQLGASGDNPGSRSALVFQPSQAGQIEWSGGAYQVVTAGGDYSSHPVTRVSWLGAVKYANWLTLDQGIAPAHRCYTESTDANLEGWHPSTISTADWSTRDLNDAEREQLVGDYRGYRLPMDDGYNNYDRTTDGADDFNEWYKAAAWSLPPGANSFTNTLYGFGRNVLTSSDANYRCSQDPFEDAADCTAGASTPVGYYDGTTKTGGFISEADNNGFGVFDMTGNVNQWIQGWYASSAAPDRRTLRGGSWDDAAASETLKLTSRLLFAPMTLTDRRIGFRVLRTIPTSEADVDGDGDVDLVDFTAVATCQLGPGVAVAASCGAADLDADGDTDLEDVADVLRQLTTTP